jgi:hypothetical protein
VSSNLFDQRQSIVGLGNKKLRNRYQKERKRLLDRIEEEKDQEIKAELRIGNVIKDYC